MTGKGKKTADEFNTRTAKEKAEREVQWCKEKADADAKEKSRSRKAQRKSKTAWPRTAAESGGGSAGREGKGIGCVLRATDPGSTRRTSS